MRKKRLIAALLVLAVTVIVCIAAQAVLMPKYRSGIIEGAMTAEYYSDEGTHDVLFVGDCELYENVSPITLWQEYGITSYIRGSAQQLIWQSYYLLEDALRYETPKVVVFNVLALKYDRPQSEAYNRMTIDGMRWSRSKINCIKASLMSDESFVEYLFPLLRYHDRWSELTQEDLDLSSDTKVTISGYYLRADVRAQTGFPPVMPLSDYTLGQNAMSYLDKMAALCEEKGIDLLLVKAPIEYPHWYDEWDAQVEQFALEHGLNYVNYIPLADELGLDMSVDTYDAGLHLNVTGAEKWAHALGAYLTDNYTLPDHRGEEENERIWQDKTAAYEAEKQRQLEGDIP